VDELRDIVLHAASGRENLPLNSSGLDNTHNAPPDTLTSRTSTAIWNREQNQIILNLMDKINCNCFHNYYAAIQNSFYLMYINQCYLESAVATLRVLLVSIFGEFGIADH